MAKEALFFQVEDQVGVFLVNHGVIAVGLLVLAFFSYQFYFEFYKVKRSSDEYDAALFEKYLDLTRLRLLRSRQFTGGKQSDRVQEVQESKDLQ